MCFLSAYIGRTKIFEFYSFQKKKICCKKKNCCPTKIEFYLLEIMSDFQYYKYFQSFYFEKINISKLKVFLVNTNINF